MFAVLLVVAAVFVSAFPASAQALPGYCKNHPDRAGCTPPPPPPPPPEPTPNPEFVPLPNRSAGWTVRCPYSHSLNDDPIVFPASPGVSHLHDFTGNTTTNANSTYTGMLAGPTTCLTVEDTGAYWMPALYNHGVRVVPRGFAADGTLIRPLIYYRKKGYSANVHIESFPPDIRILGGNSHAASPAGNPRLDVDIYYACGLDASKADGAPPDFCASGILETHVAAPSCWDGTLTHVNDTAHMTYPQGGFCPAGWHSLPRIATVTRYPVPPGEPLDITLASGAYYTLHADFWNTWDQARLDFLVDNCLNANVDCGANP